MNPTRASYLFTSESVSEGHPDKVADRISDTVVDAFLAADPVARVACETLVTTNLIVLAGEVRGPTEVIDGLEDKVRAAVRDIGYEQEGFHWRDANYACYLHSQSADIAMGVDASGNRDEGAGDQGIMFGYATAETPQFMPAALQYSHNILRALAAARHTRERPELEPDAKSQVTLVYENGRPVRAASIVVSTQHRDGLSPGDVADIVRPYVMGVLPDGFIDAATEWHINPTGNFVIGGPDGRLRPSPGERSSSIPTAAPPRTAAAPSRARTRPRSIVPAPMPAGTWPRTSSPPAWPIGARSRSASPSASPTP